ncbi:unnamed protein product [Bursaphelenchus okinawaensis]|uniref:Hexosyltransferase n=1 Tax=Bursaphelenchus okinawaensis TaxID=465554 RepID=A0A811L316_9BILA|nr:unnamed protein product [Bursaphelenchus okinawaensis]CAG9115699.1 unnamed protein product [Bursaphelenchus okinawaensis]
MQPVNHFKAQYAAHRVLIAITYVILIFSLLYLLLHTIPLQKAKLWNEEKFVLKFKTNSFEYVVRAPNGSYCDDAKAIVLLPTRPTYGGLDARLAIRDSWLKSENVPKGIKYKFVLGLPQHASQSRIKKLNRMLKEEQDEYNDMIIYNLPDTYNNLFVKTGVLLQWQQKYCANAKYVIKADDDTVIDLHRLNKQLDIWFSAEAKQYKKLVWGQVLSNSTVIRNKEDKWYLAENKYDKEYFPSYTNGAVYVMTTEATAAILNSTEKVEDIFLEDVLYTGILRQEAGISIMNVETFYPEYWFHEYCENNMPILAGVYGLSTNSVDSMYKTLQSIDCSKPKSLNGSYEYVNRGS